MSKLRVINQPLKISDLSLDELDDEMHDFWDQRAESMAIRNDRQQRKSFINMES